MALSLDDIAIHFELDTVEGEEALSKRLLAMIKSGELILQKNSYAINQNYRIKTYQAQAQWRDGKLLLLCDDGSELVAKQNMYKHLFANDRLRVRCIQPTDKTKKDMQVVSAKVLERKKEIVGRFDAKQMCVTPAAGTLGFDEKIRIYKESAKGVADGAQVLVRLAAPQFLGDTLGGHIVEVRKNQTAGEIAIDGALSKFSIPQHWSDDALAEANKAAKEVKIELDEGRRDMREQCFVTIDGETAKDFDDAILVEKEIAGTRLFVAIADVASYVRAGNALDRAAYERSNSVYFPQRVVPMLPNVLSDDTCSLRPDCDRLTLVCEMLISDSGTLLSYDFYPGLIRSKGRLTYTEVHAFLSKGKPLKCRAQGLAKMLRCAHRLWQCLDRYRQERGAVELDVAATLVHFDKDQNPSSLGLFERNDAHRLIEEFMICANVAAAKFLSQHRIDYLRRVHQGFKPDSIERLNALLKPMKLKLRDQSLASLQDLLKEAQGHAQERLIHLAVLQSFARAVYAPLDSGHFGLALEDYAHFTSPIRRYADLLVHRAIYAALGFASGATPSEEALRAIGMHCSEMEKLADDATRDIESYYKCKIIEPRVGEVFAGVVSAVTNFGLFIEIPEQQTDGLLHISKIGNDYYRFDEAKQHLRGERSGDTYHFGQKLKVRLERVDADKREVDFSLVTSRKRNTK